MRRKISHIKNLETLEEEIYQLRKRAKDIEKNIDENFTDLKENYGSMAMNSILGRRKMNGQSFWRGVATSIFESEKVQDGFSNLLDKLGDIASRLSDRIFRK